MERCLLVDVPEVQQVEDADGRPLIVVPPSEPFIVCCGVRLRPTLDDSLPVLKIRSVSGLVIRLRQLVEHREIVELERIRRAVDRRDVLMPIERVDVRDEQLVRRRRDVPVAAERSVCELSRLIRRQPVILVRGVAGRLSHIIVN